MERRDFLKLASMTGLTVAVGNSISTPKSAVAEEANTFYINFAFNGGCAHNKMWNPKPAKTEAEIPDANTGGSEVMNRYLESEIRVDSASGVSWAPMFLARSIVGNQGAVDDAMQFENFMTAYAKDMLVIRGIDIQTNAHDTGSRTSVTGLPAERTPAFGAIVSSVLLPSAPMSFISFGGYSETAGFTPVTRLGNLDAIRRLAYPYRRDPNNVDQLFFSDEQAEFIAEARKARYDAKMATQKLPKIQNTMSTLYLSRLGQNELKELVSYLPDQVQDGLAGQMQLAAAAYKAGLAVAANFGTQAGWDHHDNVDANVVASMGSAFNSESGIPGAIRVLEELDIYGKKACITFTSDFARTPGYNMGNGADHWSVTSMVLFGHINGKKIKPGVKGGSDERDGLLSVDPKTGVLKEGTNLNIKVGHIQNNLRRLAGVENSEQARRFPMAVPAGELTDLIEVI
jgi:hypothetical protein